MGIRGLLHMIINEAAFEIVDLVEEAKTEGGIEVLVDFHAFIRFIIETFVKKIAKDSKNGYLYFPMGVYDVFTDAVIDFHKGFDDAGIKLVWIVDGPKGVDELASDQKKEIWISRDEADVATMNEVLSACNLKLVLRDIKNMCVISYFETALGALKKAGAEVINLLQGESDDFIAYEYHRRSSYAILTNDTDFVIFKDCVVLFEQLLSHKYGVDNLRLPFIDDENPGKIFRQPASLRCPLIKQKHVLKLFNFINYRQLIALSILKGNDNTSAFAGKLQEHLKIEGEPKNMGKPPHVSHVAQYIASKSLTSDNLDSMQEIITFKVKYPQLKEAIMFTKDFYELKRIEDNMKKGIVIHDPTTIDDSLTGFLAKKLAEGNISKTIYSIHFGILHDGVCPEQPSAQCPPILTLLAEVRKQIYPYLLNESLNEMVEWRSRNAEKVTVPVIHSSIKTNMIKGRPCEDDGEEDGARGDQLGAQKYGIDLFEDVMTHLETGERPHFVKKYGLEKGFVCHLLRYMHLLTEGKNLRVTEKEFRGLFVTVFYQFSRSTDVTFKSQLNNDVFLGMKICPSERCLIVSSWFMNIYFTAKYLCGGAFNLTEEFPSSSQIMSGPVFYAFYENLMSDNGRVSHLEDSLIESVATLEEDIMAMYDGVFIDLTKSMD